MIKNLEEFKQILTSTTLLSNSYSKEWKNDAVMIIEFMSKAFEIEDETDTITIEILVDEDSMGSVIGKGGMLINAIRTIVQASSYANNGKKVRINIDSF